ncbi:gephyrin-like molybdotransferase Glp [Reyranella sp.]|jgi:molybdopterin molybdotransferase|uniref:molybdopterin molybdotransferase MoeA n=1 Tax=Reyranella sp. TaxID=1929291 RepID=UPI000BC732BB|nr:gephyrin-like molybdotransferase Glp [Reyranella sp.]OYY45898.1 MAG: molybdopterin molybdenumtransferase MoeA [Rhodospirillales bacterium 35-66-84]OYZ96279.1 MAG: molybdopterin molybdenumtransferase MoeA [Rhodospirillales bacterium 24-66-33]OZB28559.1 MAG: molybdopterin molybdenumtransferase MoeA [Rhodospirillales bacterium 39-66-50]HQS14223.1 molybdopterin molybdotransferase MoeA [Reyranella sp.]HQT11219.1 molybdopterin molybdotransferase MoeA [Reyranella sp.]
MLTVREAHARVIAAFSPLPSEIVSVAEAAGRVLAVSPQARLTQPPTDLSAMDGYAVRAADVPGAPATLTLVGQAPAGGSYDQALKPGEAVRIFTGGPLPMGADSIVIQEDTRADGTRITILEAPRLGRHVRKAGLDFSLGATPLAVGRTLTTRDLALAAAMNHPWLSVRRKPRVAILSTGDELVMPGEPVGRNQIVSSSGIAVAALVRGWGGEPTLFDIARDDARLIESCIEAGAQHDLLITLGGASVGDHDLVQGALKAQGFDMGFWKIAMRPGKPLMFAARDRARVLGLPGNPVSTMVCALLFLKPAMERMLGQPGDLVRTQPARLAVDVKQNDQREDYVRSTLGHAADGSLTVTPHAVQDSSMLSVLAACDAFLVRPAHDPARKEGDAVRVVDLRTLQPF